MHWHAETSVHSMQDLDTSPSEVLLLINEVVNALEKAKEAVFKMEIEKRFNSTVEATALLDQIAETMKADIADGIRQAFDNVNLSLIAQMTRINVKNDIDAACEAMTIILSFRQTWVSIFPDAEKDAFSWPHAAMSQQQRSGLSLA